MKKKCLVFMILLMVLFSFQVVSAADYTKEADMLNALGLFNGTENGYELERVPTRIEAAAMLVRLLGAVDEANEMKYEHPFSDVPEWAENIAGYLYEKGLTKGIGNNLFSSNQIVIARDYTTFMLRSLGYDSSSDFNYLEALNFAEIKGILTAEEVKVINSQDFKRNEMVLLSYKTLKTKLKGSGDSLVDKLFEKGAINKSKAFEQGLTSRFEAVITNVDSSLNKLEVDLPTVYISAEKKEITLSNESSFDSKESKISYTNGYYGSLGLKHEFPNWKGLNIKYEISFYDNGQHIKQMNYLYNDFNVEYITWRQFITPYDEFDELRISVYPITIEEISNDIDDILEVITTNDVDILKDAIKEYGSVSASGYSPKGTIDINSKDELNTNAWVAINNGKTHYSNGQYYRPFPLKYNIDGNFSIKFTEKESGLEKSSRIIKLPKNNSNESIKLIYIFDEGYKPVKVFLVK